MGINLFVNFNYDFYSLLSFELADGSAYIFMYSLEGQYCPSLGIDPLVIDLSLMTVQAVSLNRNMFCFLFLTEEA